MRELPPPLVPADVDLRDVPIPRELFARMAVDQFGIDYETALAYANDAADRVEARRSRQVRRAKQRIGSKGQTHRPPPPR